MNSTYKKLNIGLNDREILRLTILDKECKTCSSVKPLIQFYPRNRNDRTDRYRADNCIECMNKEFIMGFRPFPQIRYNKISA